MSEGGYGQNVRDEMPRQEAYKNEARGDSRPQREDYALSSQYWGKYFITFVFVYDFVAISTLLCDGLRSTSLVVWRMCLVSRYDRIVLWVDADCFKYLGGTLFCNLELPSN